MRLRDSVKLFGPIRWACIGFALSILLSGCLTPGEADDEESPAPVLFSFYLPERDLPATAVVSDEDVEGLTLADSEFDLRAGPSRMKFTFQSTQLSFSGQLDSEYCLVNDIVIVDGTTGEESIGVPAGSCFLNSWTHPDVK